MGKDLQFQLLRKEDFGAFVALLTSRGKVAAPTARDANHFSFAGVHSAGEVRLDSIPTMLPPKKYYLPQRETLLEFDMKVPSVEAVCRCEPLVLLGVRSCDITGIQCLNMVFSERPRDYNYLTRKKKIVIIGVECTRYCDGHASCALAGANLPNGGYDLLFTDLGDAYIVHVSTQAGDDIVDASRIFRPAAPSHLEELSVLRERKRDLFRVEVPVDPRAVPGIFERSFDHPVWKELDERCLACGSCTVVCPTCYCFDVRDEVRPGLARGERSRVWDSCQNEGFAAVAGGENFRPLRLARQRHRFFRKFSYPVARYHRFFCTGCGRCSRACVAGISLKDTLAALAAGGSA